MSVVKKDQSFLHFINHSYSYVISGDLMQRSASIHPLFHVNTALIGPNQWHLGGYSEALTKSLFTLLKCSYVNNWPIRAHATPVTGTLVHTTLLDYSH